MDQNSRPDMPLGHQCLYRRTAAPSRRPAFRKRVTTHGDFIQTLRDRGNVTVLDDVRFVRDDDVVTSAGVSAGINMSLWLLGEIFDEDFAARCSAVSNTFRRLPTVPRCSAR